MKYINIFIMDYITEKYLIDNYNTDGYIYCIDNNEQFFNKKVVKCGLRSTILTKKKLVKKNRGMENVNDVCKSLITRYNNGRAMTSKIIFIIKVCNVRQAEKYLFNLIKNLRIDEKKECFYWNKQLLLHAFNKTKNKFSFDALQTTIINSSPTFLTLINKKLRDT